jgi:hypothetical protein
MTSPRRRIWSRRNRISPASRRELVVGGVVFRDEHRLPFLAAELGDYRQSAIALLALTKFWQVEFDCHGSLQQGRTPA